MGAGSDDFVYAAYQWNADETAAELVPEVGAADVAPVASAPSAPLHDIPGTGTCKYCHGALPAHVLGIGTVQSSHEPGGLSLAELVAANRLTAAPAAPYVVPGNAVEQAALGYLHANCGHCHNDTDTGVTAPRFVLRLLVGDDTPAATHAYATAVNVLHTWLNAPPEAGDYRVRGGDPGSSELYFRTGVRAPGLQMPPIGSELARRTRPRDSEAVDRTATGARLAPSYTRLTVASLMADVTADTLIARFGKQKQHSEVGKSWGRERVSG